VSPITRLRRLGFRFAYALLRVYWFLFRPHLSGVKCMLVNGDRVLLVRHTYGAAEWEIPGGAVKRWEPPTRAARREMHEELGVEIDRWTNLGELPVRMHHRTGTLHCFQAAVGDGGIHHDPGEIADARWFPRDQLPVNVGPYVRPIIERLQPATAT
jgi:8-oxo-dGTP pyrophosphatase MutT (NUDIX family)